MSNRLKLLPAVITLLAGACTSIITYLVHYETKKALIILLVVLILFYILGTVFQKVIFKFELQVEKEEQERAEEEGKVVEKDIVAGEGETAQGAPAERPDGDVIPEDTQGYAESEEEQTEEYEDEDMQL